MWRIVDGEGQETAEGETAPVGSMLGEASPLETSASWGSPTPRARRQVPLWQQLATARTPEERDALILRLRAAGLSEQEEAEGEPELPPDGVLIDGRDPRAEHRRALREAHDGVSDAERQAALVARHVPAPPDLDEPPTLRDQATAVLERALRGKRTRRPSTGTPWWTDPERQKAAIAKRAATRLARGTDAHAKRHRTLPTPAPLAPTAPQPAPLPTRQPLLYCPICRAEVAPAEARLETVRQVSTRFGSIVTEERHCPICLCSHAPSLLERVSYFDTEQRIP